MSGVRRQFLTVNYNGTKVPAIIFMRNLDQFTDCRLVDEITAFVECRVGCFYRCAVDDDGAKTKPNDPNQAVIGQVLLCSAVG